MMSMLSLCSLLLILSSIALSLASSNNLVALILVIGNHLLVLMLGIRLFATRRRQVILITFLLCFSVFLRGFVVLRPVILLCLMENPEQE